MRKKYCHGLHRRLRACNRDRERSLGRLRERHGSTEAGFEWEYQSVTLCNLKSNTSTEWSQQNELNQNPWQLPNFATGIISETKPECQLLAWLYFFARETSSPLHTLTGVNALFCGRQQQQAFNNIKVALIKATVSTQRDSEGSSWWTRRQAEQPF